RSDLQGPDPFKASLTQPPSLQNPHSLQDQGRGRGTRGRSQGTINDSTRPGVAPRIPLRKVQNHVRLSRPSPTESRTRRDARWRLSGTGRPGHEHRPRCASSGLRSRKLSEGFLRLVVPGRMQTPRTQTRQYAVSANKKITVIITLFLDKDLISVYLLSWSFLCGHERIRNAGTLFESYK